ncbi:hypothetical protein [Peribacillus kribbensis]|uniref:hypothetical protein n=1 Tax=Peribacillus kribbensis TaxID=356658 RepID=UPI00138AD3CB|nr:hypothetical protein [Peribacillus kribbensis]
MILVYVLRFTAAEAGQIIGSTKGAVSACVQRAREVLREAPQNSEADLKKNAQKIDSTIQLLKNFREHRKRL